MCLALGGCAAAALPACRAARIRPREGPTRRAAWAANKSRPRSKKEQQARSYLQTVKRNTPVHFDSLRILRKDRIPLQFPLCLSTSIEIVCDRPRRYDLAIGTGHSGGVRRKWARSRSKAHNGRLQRNSIFPQNPETREMNWRVALERPEDSCKLAAPFRFRDRTYSQPKPPVGTAPPGAKSAPPGMPGGPPPRSPQSPSTTVTVQIPVNSEMSLVHVGSGNSFAITTEGRQAATLLLEALEEPAEATGKRRRAKP